MSAPSATLARVRELTKLRPKGHRSRPLPRPLSTEPIELAYFNAIEFVCGDAAQAFARVEPEIISDLTRQLGESKSDGVRWDTPSRRRKPLDAGKAKALVRQAAAEVTKSFPSREIHGIAQRFSVRTSKHQRSQLDRQVRAAFGVPLSEVETPVTANVPAWVTQNVDLIKTVPERYFARIENDVVKAFEDGTHPETLQRKLRSRYGMAQNDARRIARDQINKLNGNLNQARQGMLGVTSYIWRTMNDNRVRECHADLDGDTFDWDDPPDGGGTDEDEAGHPGSGIQCRCYPEPDLSGLLGSK